MAEVDERWDQMFPKLDSQQIARLEQFGRHRNFTAGELLFDLGQPKRAFYVLLKGQIESLNPSRSGDTIIKVLEPGEFTGEIDMLTGRPSLVRGRALVDCEVLEIDPADLRRIVQTDTDLGTIFLRAFVLRRTRLVAQKMGDAVLIGSNHSADTLRIKAFLSRNGHPYSYLDVETDQGVQDFLVHFHVTLDDIPVLICHDQPALKNPSNFEVANCLGFTGEIDGERVYDVVVVGAGPAGLASAVY